MTPTDKHKKFNWYIQKVQDHPYIFDDENEAFENAWKWWEFFKNDNEIILEIWTWLGNFFSWEVAKNPDKNYIWKEIRFKRLFVTADKTLKSWWKNFVLLKTMWQNIDKVFAKWELSFTYVLFPDPWANKDRQKKHRLWSEKFISDLYDRTKVGWKVIFKTDHREYFDSTIELLEKFWKWKILEISYDYDNDMKVLNTKKLTEFEVIFRTQKIKINYIELQK